MGEKDGVWEDNDSETLERKTATEMPRDRAGRDMAGCSQEPLRKALGQVQEHKSFSPPGGSHRKPPFCSLAHAKPAISNIGCKPMQLKT